jgi:hypothetical protein
MDGHVVDLPEEKESSDRIEPPSNTPIIAARNKKGPSVRMDIQEPERGWQTYLYETLGDDAINEIRRILDGGIPSYVVDAPTELTKKVTLLKAIQVCYDEKLLLSLR